MSEQKPCELFFARAARCLQLRVRHSSTKDLAAGRCVTARVIIDAGFRCTARCWPHWSRGSEPGWIKLSVEVARAGNLRLDVVREAVAVHMDLRTRDGRPLRTAVPEPVAVSEGRCLGGASVLAKREEVEKDCVADDHFVALCLVAVVKDWPPSVLASYGVGHDISNMEDLADVSFEVEGKTFKAHRLMLAARSPVFKALLFGQMAESRTTSCITIQDMKASTFGYMLYFMYHNVLPRTAPSSTDAASVMVEFQDLFIAADRYGLDMLKQMCEDVLCACIAKDTVIAALEFTEEQTCPGLKSRCLDFLAVADNLKEVAATEEYIRLMYTLPSLLMEVQDRMKRPRLA
ncbi:hypothetical protein ACP70R_006558 [Stipagrostis hirtigluma subsp. patula]